MTRMARRPSTAVVGVILAAGGSTRLGQPKQLLRHAGRPLLARVVDAAARATGRPPVVVLGAERLRLRALLRRCAPRCAVVVNARWQEGMGGSLRAGLRSVPADVAAALCLVTDQPAVGAQTLHRLLRAWRRYPQRPAAACYADRLGTPAVIPRRSFGHLRRLQGDIGARRVLAAAPRVTSVELPEARLDVDLPEHLGRLRRGPSHS